MSRKNSFKLEPACRQLEPPALKKKPFSYLLLRKSRCKSVSLEVTSTNKVIVRAPRRYSKNEIDIFVVKKFGWIRKQIAVNEAVRKPPLKRDFSCGENYLYLGDYYTLFLRQGNPSVGLDGRNLVLSAFKKHLEKKEYIRSKLKNWYKTAAYKVILSRVSFFERVLGISVSGLQVRHFERSWGNCSSKRVVSFNANLVMAPLPVIDYVVAHELAHIKIPNHSPQLWGFLRKFIPDYRQRKNWLFAYENQLCL